MSTASDTKKNRFWVFFIVLTFVGQMLGVSTHATAMIDNPPERSGMSTRCHGDNDTAMDHNFNNTEEAKTQQKTCCEDGCSMTDCNSVSAILGSHHNFPLVPGRAINSILHLPFISALVSSLYRPPILD